MLLQSGAKLKSLNYDEDDRSLVDLKVNFLVDEVTTKNEFNFYLAQNTSEPYAETTGTVGFQIFKQPRSDFDADAGHDEQINYGDSVTITAAQINEAAEYNWYNSAGELVYTGTSLTVAPHVSETYQLEVIADADGYKDYSDVEVEVQPFEIISASPNPVSSLLTVDYSAENASSAYLMLVESTTNNTSNNYILNTAQQQTVIDLSALNTGNYSLALVCDGQIADAVNLIIQ